MVMDTERVSGRREGPDWYTVLDDEMSEVPLSHVAASTNNTVFADEHLYVKYDAWLSSTAHVGGVMEADAKHIQYNIGVRGPAGYINVWDCTTPVVTGDVFVPEALHKDIRYALKRIPPLQSTFTKMNLLGIVERLASGLAHFATWGHLDTLQLRGGRNWDLEVLVENVVVPSGSL